MQEAHALKVFKEDENLQKAQKYRNAFTHRFSPRSLISIYHKYDNGSIGFGLNTYIPSKMIINNSVKALDILSDILIRVKLFISKEYKSANEG